MNIFEIASLIGLGFILGFMVNALSDLISLLSKYRISDAISYMIYKTLHKYPVGINLHYAYRYRIQRVYIIRYLYILITFYLRDTSESLSVFIIKLILYTLFGILMVIDIENKIILFPLNIIGLIIGFYHGIVTNNFFVTIIGGAIGMVIYLIIFFMGVSIKWLIKNTFSQHLNGDLLGFGDVILACTIGLVVGWPIILSSLLITIFLSGLVSIFIIVTSWLRKRYQKFYSIAYSPYLIAGAIITLNYQSILGKLLKLI